MSYDLFFLGREDRWECKKNNVWFMPNIINGSFSGGYLVMCIEEIC